MSYRGLKDLGLSVLLGLDGEIFPMDNGYWTKIDAKMVKQSEGIPHGVRYSLTLHDKSNSRVLGYDNAHRFNTGRKGFKTLVMEWDHIHEGSRVRWYKFESTGQLMEDFWNDVNRIIGEV